MFSLFAATGSSRTLSGLISSPFRCSSMANPYKSPSSHTTAQGDPAGERFARTSDRLITIPILGFAIIAGVFGFASGVDQLPWHQSTWNTWQSMVWGVIVGIPSTALCYLIANMLSSSRRMLFVVWAITAPLFPAIFSHVFISALAGC